VKFIVFGDNRLGLWEGSRVLDLTNARSLEGQPYSSLQTLIDDGERGLDKVRRLADRAGGSDQPGLWLEMTDVQLRAPWPGQRFALAGANNADHMASAFTNMGTPRTADEMRAAANGTAPAGFWALARPIMGPGDDIEIPARADGYFDYEGEPAIVLAKRAKDIKGTDIKKLVWGVTLVNDWSIREPVWPPASFDPWALVKNFDSSKSVGPCIVVDEVDLDDFRIETLVNDQLRQSFLASDMIFSFAEILEHLSRDFTLLPGDVISGGTGSGTAIDQTVPNADGSWPRDGYLRPGDRVEVRSAQIGSLVNTVVRKGNNDRG
jgi:2-keto-4-pentenoate hydratase/2-oxohepta-3-ene-1,7-dioic acid hydratase in catechol pathway